MDSKEPEKRKSPTAIKLTTKAKTVLSTVASFGVKGCGVKPIITGMGLKCGRVATMIAGGYAGKLERAGWLEKRDEYRKNRFGKQSFNRVVYSLTEAGRIAINLEKFKVGAWRL